MAHRVSAWGTPKPTRGISWGDLGETHLQTGSGPWWNSAPCGCRTAVLLPRWLSAGARSAHTLCHGSLCLQASHGELALLASHSP